MNSVFSPRGAALKMFDTSVFGAILSTNWYPVTTTPWWIRAQVAELVDALASGASGLMVVEVRVFSWAPFFKKLILRTSNISVTGQKSVVFASAVCG